MNNPTGEIRMRRATLDDAKDIATLTDATYGKYVPRMRRKPQPMTADYHEIIAEHVVWLLLLGGQLAGLLILMEQPGALLIYSVAVKPEWQGRGLGRYLLAWAEQQARAAGHTEIRLYTNEHMVENIDLYRRAGYQETRREHYVGSNIVHMAKAL